MKAGYKYSVTSVRPNLWLRMKRWPGSINEVLWPGLVCKINWQVKDIKVFVLLYGIMPWYGVKCYQVLMPGMPTLQYALHSGPKYALHTYLVVWTAYLSPAPPFTPPQSCDLPRAKLTLESWSCPTTPYHTKPLCHHTVPLILWPTRFKSSPHSHPSLHQDCGLWPGWPLGEAF